MWITTDQNRLTRLERAIAYLTCKFKKQEETEADSIFKASPAYTITQENIDDWNNGGKGDTQLIETVSTNYSLVPTSKTIMITFKGNTENFNLPLVSNYAGTIILLYNEQKTLDVNIVSNSNDGSVVIDGGMMMTSTVLTSGSPMTIFNNGKNWIAKP